MLLEGFNLRDTFDRWRFYDGLANKTINKFLMVGAFLDEEELSLQDEDYLKGVLTSLMERKVTVANDCTIEIVNLEYDEDFLDGNYDADAIILCNLYNPNPDRPMRKVSHWCESYHSLSQNHYDENVWYEAIMRTGAGMVFVTDYGGPEDFGWNMVKGEELVFIPSERDCLRLLVRKGGHFDVPKPFVS